MNRIRITNQDLELGREFAWIAYQCQESVECLWGIAREEDICPLKQKGKECPLLNFRIQMEFFSPSFYNLYLSYCRAILLEKAGAKKFEIGGFLFLSLQVLGSLWSSNQKLFPQIPEGFTDKIIEEVNNLPEITIISQFISEFKEISESWYQDLTAGIAKHSLGEFTQNALLSLAKILIEGIKTFPAKSLKEKAGEQAGDSQIRGPLPEGKEAVKFVENFLREERRKNK